MAIAKKQFQKWSCFFLWMFAQRFCFANIVLPSAKLAKGIAAMME